MLMAALHWISPFFKYFANSILSPTDCSGKAQNWNNEHQKAIKMLQELVQRNPLDDSNIVCGWELLDVLRLLHDLPSQKFWVTDWESRVGSLSSQESEPILKAIRSLVRVGAKTKCFLHMVDLLMPVRSCETGFGGFRSPRSGCSLIDTEDMSEVNSEAAAKLDSFSTLAI